MKTAWAFRARWFVAILALVSVMAPGCGDDEEPGTAETPGAAVPGDEAAPAVAEKPATGELHLAQFAPADPLMVAVFPSVQSLETEVVGLATRLSPPETDVKAMLAEISAQWAQGLGLSGAETPTQVLLAMGIDPAKPIGLYVDADEFSARYLEEVDRLKAEADAKEAAEPAEGEPAMDDTSEPVEDETPVEGVEVGAGAENEVSSESVENEAVAEDVEFTETVEDAEDMEGAEPEMDEGAGDDFMMEMSVPAINPFEVAGLPAIAIAFTVSDAEKAVAQLDTLLQMSPESATFEKKEVDTHGVKMTVYDPKYCSYFVHGDMLFVGNEQAWLEQVAAAVEQPGAPLEGLPKAPYDDEQMLIALRADQMLPLMYAVTKGNTLQPGQAGMMAEMQLATWEQMKHFYEGTDPVLATLRWSPAGVMMDTRMNLDKHPALKEISGAPGPMLQASALPTSTMAVMSVKLTPEMKAGIQKYWIDAMPDEMLQDPSVAGMMAGFTQTFGLIEDEVTLGITGIENNIPTGIAMIGLADPKAVFDQFGFFVVMGGGTMPEMPAEPGAIQELTFAETMTVYYTVLGKALMVATSRTELEEAVANLKASQASGYFGSLAPALDPKTPRYFLLSLRPQILEALMALQGGAGAEDPSVRQAIETIKEVRVTQEMDGPWMSQEMALYLNAQ